MKIRVNCDQVQPGMYLVGFEGSWIDHPFWRRHFILTEKLVDAIRSSDVSGIYIDDEKGLPPEKSISPLSSATLVPHVLARQSFDQSMQRKTAPSTSTRKHREEEHAAVIVAEAKQALTKVFREARLGHAISTDTAEIVVDRIAETVSRDASALMDITRLKRKDDYTYMHSIAVCVLMICLGRELRLPENIVREIGLGGLLHDIGKIVVPKRILEKPSTLTAEEMAIIQTHPTAGHEIVSEAPDISDIVRDICLNHHERLDGKGYPSGLEAAHISLYARMAAICDVYDAVTSNRPYKKPWSPADALKKMSEWEGHFDITVFYAFARSIGIYPIGSLVRLRTNRLAIIVDGNEREPKAPLTRAFYSTRSNELIPFSDIKISASLSGDNIIGLENGSEWFGILWLTLSEKILANDPSGAAKCLTDSARSNDKEEIPYNHIGQVC